eukprot:COSAG01_NODE_676_length_14324_cov_17.420105_13_plen_85_part_00
MAGKWRARRLTEAAVWLCCAGQATHADTTLMMATLRRAPQAGGSRLCSSAPAADDNAPSWELEWAVLPARMVPRCCVLAGGHFG